MPGDVRRVCGVDVPYRPPRHVQHDVQPWQSLVHVRMLSVVLTLHVVFASRAEESRVATSPSVIAEASILQTHPPQHLSVGLSVSLCVVARYRFSQLAASSGDDGDRAGGALPALGACRLRPACGGAALEPAARVVDCGLSDGDALLLFSLPARAPRTGGAAAV